MLTADEVVGLVALLVAVLLALAGMLVAEDEDGERLMVGLLGAGALVGLGGVLLLVA